MDHTKSNNFPETEVRELFMDSRGYLWVGTSGKGLFVQTKDGGFINYKVADGLVDNVVNAISEDFENNLWIGTDRGLMIFKQGKFDAYLSKRELEDTAITSLALDGSGNMWIGTWGVGVYEKRGGLLRNVCAGSQTRRFHD